MKKLLYTITGLAGAFNLMLLNAHAQGSDAFFTGSSTTSIKAVSQSGLAENIQTILNYALGFLGLIAVAFIIYGGILLVTSAGSDDAMGKAKKILTYAAIGIVIIMLSYTIVTFVTSALG